MRTIGRIRHSLVIALIVALGIGASVAGVGIWRYGIVGTLPFDSPADLVILENQGTYDLGVRHVKTPQLSWPDYDDLSAQSSFASKLGAVMGPEQTTWTANERRRSIHRYYVTADLLTLLGASPVSGRMVDARDFKPGAVPAAVITASAWRRQFAGHDGVVGKDVTIEGVRYTVAGVVPDEVISSLKSRKALFERDEIREAVLLPMVPVGGRAGALLQVRRTNRGRPALLVIGRIRPGITIEAAQHAVNEVAAALAQRYPDSNAGRSIRLVGLDDWRTRELSHLGPLLICVAILAWLAGCASAVGLVLADVVRRQPETAIRRALGANTRSLLVDVARRALGRMVPASVVGAGIAHTILLTTLPAETPSQRGMATMLVTYVALLTVSSTIVLGVVEALALWSGDTKAGLKEASYTRLPSRQRRFWLGAVIGSQVAAATSLGVVSLLLVQSLAHVVSTDLGFDPKDTLIVRMFLPDEEYQPSPEGQRTFDRASVRLQTLPGVTAVGQGTTPPFSGVVVTVGRDLWIEGPGLQPKALTPMPGQYVSAGYFGAIGMRFVRGRTFHTHVADVTSPGVVVDESFCRQWLLGIDPLDARLRIAGVTHPIIGVVGDVHPDGPTAETRSTLYFHEDWQHPRWFGHFVVRTVPGAGQVIRDRVVGALLAVAPDAVVDEPQQLEDLWAATHARRRWVLTMLLLAGVVVLALTVFSISGALGEYVASRRGDLAVRRALGATEWRTIRVLASQLAVPMCGGALCGGLLGWGLGRVITNELFGITPGDPLTMALAIAAVQVFGVGGIVVPAARALAISPAELLKE